MSQPRTYGERCLVGLAQIVAVVAFIVVMVTVAAILAPERLPS